MARTQQQRDQSLLNNPFIKLAATFQSFIPQFIQRPIQRTVGRGAPESRTLRALAQIQKIIERPIPRASFADRIDNPVAAFIPQVAQSVINAPRTSQIAGIGLGKQLEKTAEGKEVKGTEVIANLAQAADLPVTLATLGIGKAAITNITKQSFKEILKQAPKETLKKIAKEGVRTGLAPGLAFGAIGSLEAGREAKDIPEQLTNAIVPTLVAGAAGATLAGAAPILTKGAQAGLGKLLRRGTKPGAVTQGTPLPYEPAPGSQIVKSDKIKPSAFDIANVTKERVNFFKAKIINGDKIDSIIVGEDRIILDGHNRFKAFQELGITDIPVKVELQTRKLNALFTGKDVGRTIAFDIKREKPIVKAFEGIAKEAETFGVEVPKKPTPESFLTKEAKATEGARPELSVIQAAREFGKQIFQGSVEAIKAQGPSARVLGDKIMNSRILGSAKSGVRRLGLTENVRGFSKKERINLGKVLDDGLEVPMNDKVRIAAIVERPRLNETLRDVQSVDSSIGTIKGYFPHVPNEEAAKLISKRPNEAATRLAEYQNISFSEAQAWLQTPTGTPIKPGSLRERGLKLPPEWREHDVINVLDGNQGYYSQVSLYAERARELGPHGEKLTQLIGKVAQEGGDVKFVIEAIDKVLGTKKFSPVKVKLFGALVNIQTVSKITFRTTIQNKFQGFNLTAVRTGNLLEAAFGFAKAHTKSGQAQAQKLGVMETVIDELYGSKKTGFVSKYMRFIRFPQSEKVNHATAGVVGERFVRRLASQARGETLIKSKIPGLSQLDKVTAKRQLKSLGLDPDKIIKEGLSEGDLLKGVQTFDQQTIFPNLREIKPDWANSPEGRAMFQFKSYTFRLSLTLKRHVFEEAMKGNIGPALSLAAVSQIIGEPVGDARAFVKDVVSVAFGNEPTALKERGTGINRIVNNTTEAVGLGLLFDAFEASKYGLGAVGSFIGGPTFGTVTGVVGGVGQSLRGDVGPLGKTITGLIPGGLGRDLGKTIFDSSSPTGTTILQRSTVPSRPKRGEGRSRGRSRRGRSR